MRELVRDAIEHSMKKNYEPLISIVGVLCDLKSSNKITKAYLERNNNKPSSEEYFRLLVNKLIFNLRDVVPEMFEDMKVKPINLSGDDDVD